MKKENIRRRFITLGSVFFDFLDDSFDALGKFAHQIGPWKRRIYFIMIVTNSIR